MMHIEHTLSETVEVEAGIVADIATGELRSRAMDHHYALRVESLNRRQAEVRRNKVAKWLLLSALAVATAIFTTNESARKMAGQAWADFAMMADSVTM